MNERILFAFTKANGHVQTKPEFSPSTLAAPTTSGCDSPSCTAKSMQKKGTFFLPVEVVWLVVGGMCVVTLSSLILTKREQMC